MPEIRILPKSVSNKGEPAPGRPVAFITGTNTIIDAVFWSAGPKPGSWWVTVNRQYVLIAYRSRDDGLRAWREIPQ